MADKRDARTGQNTADETDEEAQAGSGKKNVSAEPLPELSEHGGIEPKERDAAKYNDRTRDRELDES